MSGVKISEAYQVLSNEDLRKQYDKYGKERAVPDSGFGETYNHFNASCFIYILLTASEEDPAEFFGMIFGGEAFVDL